MKTKKLLAFVMASAMVLSMAACGGSSSSGNSGSSDAAADNSGSTDTADTQTFKLGSIGPLTGDYAIYGQAVVNGAKLLMRSMPATTRSSSSSRARMTRPTAKSLPTPKTP